MPMQKRTAAPEEMPVPGAAPQTTANLLHGTFGLATIGGITVLHLYEWEIRFRSTLTEVTAHGDEWEQWIHLRQGFTGRARGYLSRSAQTTGGPPTNAPYHYSMLDLNSSPTPVIFTGYSDWGTNKLIEGEILAEDITLTVPMAMVEQEITFRGTIAPTQGPQP